MDVEDISNEENQGMDVDEPPEPPFVGKNLCVVCMDGKRVRPQPEGTSDIRRQRDQVRPVDKSLVLHCSSSRLRNSGDPTPDGEHGWWK